MNGLSLAVIFSAASILASPANADPNPLSLPASSPAPYIAITGGPQERPDPPALVRWDELPSHMKSASLPSDRVVAYCLAKQGVKGAAEAKAALALCMEPDLKAIPAAFLACHQLSAGGAEGEYFAQRRKCLLQLGGRIGG
jgi:hypothetical protein